VALVQVGRKDCVDWMGRVLSFWEASFTSEKVERNEKKW
jgi:hypothetical protein